MASLLTLLAFYAKYWQKEAKIFNGLIQIHAIILGFNFLYPKLAALTIPIIVLFLMQVFYYDWELRNDFYNIFRIRPIDRHYIKILLTDILILTFVFHLQVKNTLSLTTDQMLLAIVYCSLLFALAHSINKKAWSIVAYILACSISVLLTKTELDIKVHILFISGLIFTNVIYYRVQIRKYQ